MGLVWIFSGIGLFALAAALIDWRTRRSGHRVPSGYDLDKRIPEAKLDVEKFSG